MELRQLKYFQKTCELLSFTEAARTLCITQSTLSQQIKQLETELGTLLFDRVGKRIIPTEAGLSFLPYAKKAISEAENGVQIIRDLQNIEIGTLRIGITYSLSPLLTKALTIFSKQYPKIQTTITFATSEELMEKLNNDEMDFVLSFDSGNTYKPFEKQFLFSSYLYLILNKNHPWAKKTFIQFENITAIPLIIPAKGFVTRGIVDSICSKKGIKINIEMEINDVHTIINLVRNGKQGTILTHSAVRNEDDLIKIPIYTTDIELSTKAYLFWPQGSYRKKAALRFAQILFQLSSENSSGLKNKI